MGNNEPHIERSGAVRARTVHYLLGLLAVILAVPVQAQPQDAAAGDDVPLLEPVEVQVPPQAERHRTVSFLGDEDLERQRLIILNDALFSGVPGVATSRQSNVGFFGPAGGFLIRGFGRQQTSVFVDGIPSQATNHFHPISDQYTPDMIDRVEVVRSPTGLRDGPNAVGSVHIFTPAVPREGYEAEFSGTVGRFDTRFVNGRVGFGWGSGGIWFGGQHNRTEGVRDAGIDAFTVNLKLEQDIGEHWTTKLRLATTEDVVDARRPDGVPPSRSETCFCTDAVVLTFDRTAMHSGTTLSMYFNGAEFRTRRLPDGTSVNRKRQDENEYGVRFKQVWSHLFPGNTTTFGADGVRFTINEPRHVDVYYWSPYVQTSQNLELIEGQPTTVTTGLRYTDSKDFDLDLSPELGVVHQLSDTLALRVNLSKGFQIPRASQLGAQPDNGAGGVQFGNQNLEPAEFYNEEIGLNKVFNLGGRRAVLDVVGFLTQGDNQLAEVFDADNNSRVENTGSFDHKGVELSFEVDVFPWMSIFIAESYVDLEAETDRAPMPEQILDARMVLREGPVRFTWQTRDARRIFIRRTNGNFRVDNYRVSSAQLAFAVNRQLSIAVDAENILDEDFTTFATVRGDGSLNTFSQPGRSWFVTLRWEPSQSRLFGGLL